MTVDEAQRPGALGTQRLPHEPTDIVRKSCGCLPGWYVVATQPSRQYAAETLLAATGWDVFHPLHLHRTLRHPDKVVSLFPGYLFVHLEPEALWQRIASTPGVVHVLGSGGQPRPVPTGMVEDLQARTSARRIVDDPLTPGAPPYGPGARLAVRSGPLAGWSGICAMAAADRVMVLLSMFGRDVPVALAPGAVMPA